jgi:hypothetical protein
MESSEDELVEAIIHDPKWLEKTIAAGKSWELEKQLNTERKWEPLGPEPQRGLFPETRRKTRGR